jgi:rare lipoprotein A
MAAREIARKWTRLGCDTITTLEGNSDGEIVADRIWPPCRPDWIPILTACWFSAWAGARVGDATMSIDCTGTSYVGTGRQLIRLLAVALGGALLGACAQSSVVSQRSEHLAVRQASLEPDRPAHFVTKRRVASVKKHTPFASRRDAGDRKVASSGIASFYTEGTQTASGEKFDTHDLTAAHPTLPFGTRLRVTNVSTGRSVTVRVNDRGPYVPGRIVDVSYSAADALGMVGHGVANVKLDVVQ